MTVVLGPQLHVAHDRWLGPPESDFLSNLNPFCAVKPWGFWTSTAIGEGRSAWTRLCHDVVIERERVRWPPAAFVRLEVVGAPRIHILEDDADLHELVREYAPERYVDHRERDEHLHDVSAGRWDLAAVLSDGAVWEAIATRVDGIHFTNGRGGAAGESVHMLGWECESTVWFRPSTHLRVVNVRVAAENLPVEDDVSGEGSVDTIPF